MFEIIATKANDPDGYCSDMRTKLLEIADTMPLAPMAAAREGKVRAFVKETVGIDQPASQLVAAGAVLEDEKRRMGRASAETIRQPRERPTGQPQERQHSADAERGGTRDRLQSRDRLRRHPYAGQ
jgi:hypothetical protein